MIRAKDYRVRGRVQGVGYRYFISDAAERLGVKGFIRNLPDGDVEVHAEADAAALQLFKLELERGPRHAHVAEIIESDGALGAHSSFLIRG